MRMKTEKEKEKNRRKERRWIQVGRQSWKLEFLKEWMDLKEELEWKWRADRPVSIGKYT